MSCPIKIWNFGRRRFGSKFRTKFGRPNWLKFEADSVPNVVRPKFGRFGRPYWHQFGHPNLVRIRSDLVIRIGSDSTPKVVRPISVQFGPDLVVLRGADLVVQTYPDGTTAYAKLWLIAPLWSLWYTVSTSDQFYYKDVHAFFSRTWASDFPKVKNSLSLVSGN